MGLFLTEFWHSLNLRIDCHQSVVIFDHLIEEDFLFPRKLLYSCFIELLHPNLLCQLTFVYFLGHRRFVSYIPILFFVLLFLK